MLNSPTSLINRSVAAVLPYVPRPLVWRISRRYIAGVSLEDAYRVIRELNQLGAMATLDVLGEDVTDPEQVTGYRDLYLQALRDIADQGLDCNISVKLSEMGLRFEPERCLEIMAELADAAAERGNFVRIDMEDSSVTDDTLDLYRRLRESHGNVGAVIQAYLRRSRDDVEDLLTSDIAHLRLCKGIYVEPAEIAFKEPQAINASFRELLELLIDGRAEKVGIATHDPALVSHAKDLIATRMVSRERYEFQMLLGVAEPLRDELIREGHPVRIYVPFGEHWFAYSSRRLRENPAIAGHVIRGFFRPN